MKLVLQANWLLEPFSPTLPIWLITVGLESIFIGFAVKSAKEMGLWNQLNQRQQAIGVFGIAVGYFFAALSVISVAFHAYSVYLFLLFRMVEGGATVQIYRKIIDFFNSGTPSGTFKAKIRHRVVSFFILGIGVYLMFIVVTSGPIFRGFSYDLSLIYTVLLSILTFISVRWRLRKAEQEFNTAIVSGIAFGVAGAQTYGFTLVGDVTITIAGVLTYSIGFWIAAWYFLGDELFGKPAS